MYKILLIVCIGWLAISNPVAAQTSILKKTVTVNRSSISIQEILQVLASEHQIDFSYSKDIVSLKKQVTIKAFQLPLREVLDKIFTGTEIHYMVIGSQIVLHNTLEKKSGVTITGYVTDALTGEALAGATLIYGATSISSNTYGFYSIEVPREQIKLEVRYMGYSYLFFESPPLSKDTFIPLKLTLLSKELKEVKIKAESLNELQQMGKISMSSTELKQLPRLMGETDAIKAFQLMPGVQGGREGSSNLIVRGGSPDQNLILLDGVPVYNVAHLLGVFSVFNPDAIQKVDMIKGGFPAPYGGRLSSVVDIRFKEGNNQSFAGEGSVGLISSKLLLEGPLKDEKTSFLLAARRTYLDLVTAVLGKNNNSYNFYDLNAKVNHTYSSTNRIYLSIYTGLDKFKFRDQPETEQKFNMKWGNTTGSLRWNHIYGNRLFSNVTLTRSTYSFSQNSELNTVKTGIPIDRKVSFNSSINDWGAKADFDFAASNNHSMRFGGSYIYHKFTPESATLVVDTLNFTTSSFSRIFAHEVYTYAEDRILINNNIEAIAGIHLSGFTVNGRNYTSLQPRLALGYTSNKGLSLRTSYASMAQYLHLLSNTSTGSPTDVWAPATEKVKPQRSWQATIGGAISVIRNQFELNVDLYYKKMKDVAEFKDGGDFVGEFLRSGPDTKFTTLIVPSYEERVTSGIGWSYGSEWMIRKLEGNTSGWIGYTLSYAMRQLKDVNNNKPYPYTYDSRHSAVLVVNHKLSKNLSIGGSWLYRSGYVATLPLSNYKPYNESANYNNYSKYPEYKSIDNLNVRNNYRMPSYHRMDLSITHIKQKKWGERSWNVSIYNVYNRHNPYYMELSPSHVGSTTSPRLLNQVSLLPILPSFSYGFKF